MDVKCSNLYVNAHPTMVTLDYVMDMSILSQNQDQNGSANPQKPLFNKDNRYDKREPRLSGMRG